MRGTIKQQIDRAERLHKLPYGSLDYAHEVVAGVMRSCPSLDTPFIYPITCSDTQATAQGISVEWDFATSSISLSIYQGDHRKATSPHRLCILSNLEDAIYTFEPCGLSIEKICLVIACHLAKKPKADL